LSTLFIQVLKVS